MHFRTKIINKLILNYNYNYYLEIGLDGGVNFNNVNATYKCSVDTNDLFCNPTHKMTSAEFFKNNNQYYDIIFIDGLHIFDVAYLDLLNSLYFLRKGGAILLHDTFPKKYEHQTVPPSDPCWSGDVWKVVLKAQTCLSTVNIKTYDVESGSTIFTKTNNRILNSELNENYTYDYFKYNFKTILNLVTVDI